MTTEQLKKTFGQNLRKYRNQSGLSQTQLAKETGIDRGIISKMETGRRNVTLETIVKFCNAFSIAPYEFLVD